MLSKQNTKEKKTQKKPHTKNKRMPAPDPWDDDNVTLRDISLNTPALVPCVNVPCFCTINIKLFKSYTGSYINVFTINSNCSYMVFSILVFIGFLKYPGFVFVHINTIS